MNIIHNFIQYQSIILLQLSYKFPGYWTEGMMEQNLTQKFRRALTYEGKKPVASIAHWNVLQKQNEKEKGSVCLKCLPPLMLLLQDWGE